MNQSQQLNESLQDSNSNLPAFNNVTIAEPNSASQVRIGSYDKSLNNKNL